MDLTAALKWVDAAANAHSGYSLREPEIVILKGTWQGLTYEQMANSSEYSTNYLMRDVAPKLWKQLSNVFGRSVGKTNFRVALEAFAAANAALEREIMSSDTTGAADSGGMGSAGFAGGSGFLSEANDGWSQEGNAAGSAAGNAADRSRAWNRSSAILLSADAVVPSVMYGYGQPLEKLKQWLSESVSESDGRSHLIGVWGLWGVGKTLLVETALAQTGDCFEGIVWCSLRASPSLDELSVSVLNSVGVVPQPLRPVAQLLALLATRPFLLVLEGAESILRPGVLAGDYQPGYQTYGEFFQSLSNSRSCVVLMGIEGPATLVRQSGEGTGQSVRSLTLDRLDEASAVELLQAESLATPECWPELIERYQGHPLALKSAARVIREIFNGQVDAFLRQSSVLFKDIFRLLSPSFERLSAHELNILYWLASQDVAVSLAELRQTLPLSLRPSELISALDSLKQRSLLSVQLEIDPPKFQLPALVKAYAFHQFMAQFSSDTTLANADNTSANTMYGRGGIPVINLSPRPARPVQLSKWFTGEFNSEWHSLDWLFESAQQPAMRLRSAYHLRDETFLKKCKSIDFNVTSLSKYSSGITLVEEDELSPKSSPKVVLLMAIHQDAADLYKVCAQAQPGREESILPEKLALNLLDAQKTVLATVMAEQNDTFIQLPYFRGAVNEAFEIEMVLEDNVHTEKFII